MGTRHLICVFYKDRFVVAQHGQWDSSPKGQGVTFMKFLRMPNQHPRLKDRLEHIYEPSKQDVSAAKDKSMNYTH